MKLNLPSIKHRLGNDSRLLTVIHGLCLFLCAVLGFACYYLANQPNEILYDSIELPMPVEEAERLMASSESWRDDYHREQEKGRVLLQRAKQTIQWLPVQRDWSHSMQDIQQLADRCNVELIEMSPGDVFTGSRVSVQSAVCQLQGSYPSICRFLDGLTKIESPVWASELTMQNDPGSGKLTVVTHLRLPLAGTNTAGAYLIHLVGDSTSASPRTPPVAEASVVTRMERSHDY